MRKTSPCRDCGSPVLWTITADGKRMAVDPDPHVDGNTAVYRDANDTWHSRRPTSHRPVMGWERMHKPHVATCTGQRRKARPKPLPPGVADLSAYRRRPGRR